ncbi:hypothetical protein HELRODRAFT_167075 [Helobdella robusta]|uniref:Uncharacterized protein n=1 Tax=Helobdella robusta TaxID=6412 RepID=T1EYZ4_HELRO|nr:hypothetical protein HELRODRAFT_167075 [Helobdella robusta]ESO10573.1 hypothetical protein HELRODRAFT_167075 [Helobdella robusta]
MASDEIKIELVKYGRTTSLRGVPKLLSSDDKVLKTLWMASLITCSMVLIYLLITSFYKYYTWPIMTQYGEMIGDGISFPDVTFCNIDPFSAGYPSGLTIDSYFDFLKSNKQIIKNISANDFNLTKSEESFMYRDLLSIPGYISNLPKHYQIEKLDCPNFIVDCNVFAMNWLGTNIDCTENITKFWDRDYYTCFTLRTSKINIAHNITVKGLTFILNVGPPNYDQLPIRSTIVGSQTRGVQVSVHSPGSSPDLKRGFSVAPGTEAVVTIVQTKNKRLNQPYHVVDCTNELKMPSYPKEKYSRDLCIEYCKQKLIHETCGCMSNYLNVPPSVLDSVDLCGNFTINKANLSDASYNQSNIRNVIEGYLCSMDFLDIDSCSPGCLIRCEKTVYSTYIAISPWPQPALQLNLFGSYIYNCTKTDEDVKTRYSKYLQLYDDDDDIQIDSIQSVNSISELTQIQESLLVVKLIMKDTFPFYLIDQPAITWDSMLGIIGGTLSLWLGITVSTGVELLELVYLIISSYFKNKNKNSSANESAPSNSRVFAKVLSN